MSSSAPIDLHSLAGLLRQAIDEICKSTDAGHGIYAGLPYQLEWKQLVSKGSKVTRSSEGEEVQVWLFDVPAIPMFLALSNVFDQWAACPTHLRESAIGRLRAVTVAGPRYAGMLADDLERIDFSNQEMTRFRDEGYTLNQYAEDEQHIFFLRQRNPYNLHPLDRDDPPPGFVVYDATHTHRWPEGSRTVHLELTLRIPLPPRSRRQFTPAPRTRAVNVLTHPSNFFTLFVTPRSSHS